MFNDTGDLFVTGISLAIFVAPGSGAAVHADRPRHGLVYNCAEKVADYVFSDGTVMKTRGGSLFYLPKGSSYRVITKRHGQGCYAINFDLAKDPNAAPFCIQMRDGERTLRAFKDAVDAFHTGSVVTVLRDIYEIILLARREYERSYLPSGKTAVLKPALDEMNARYTQNGLTVCRLSELCGISETYFRRLFAAEFGISPKEYIIRRRIEYAKRLLSSGQFTVAETAEMCGYSEPCHFSREFKKRAGAPPAEFR